MCRERVGRHFVTLWCVVDNVIAMRKIPVLRGRTWYYLVGRIILAERPDILPTQDILPKA